MDDAEFTERRRYPRVAVDLTIQYRPEGGGSKGLVRKDRMMTIGEGGCFIQTKLTYPRDTRLELSFMIDAQQVRATATVRYAVPYNPKVGGVQFPGMGLMYVQIDSKHSEAIHKFVQQERTKQGLP